MTKEKKKKECKDCKNYKNQLEELKNLMKRVQADFENHQKRAEKGAQKAIVYANQKMAVDLLPVIDSFEAAMENSDEGLKILYTQLMKTLQAYGLQKIESEGEKFNPEMHEAMLTEEGKEDGVVLDELQSGYVMNDVVVRPAKVKISKKKQENKDDLKNPKKDDNKKNSSKKDN